MRSPIDFYIRKDSGDMRGPIELMRKVKWKPSPHIEYEPSDEVWGLFFNFGELGEPLMPGDKFSLARFTDVLEGTAFVTNCCMNHQACELLYLDIEFVLEEQFSCFYKDNGL